MTIITKIDIDSEKLNIEYKGSTPGAAPAPAPAGDTVIMSYYGQWNIYDGKFPVPSYATAKADIYDKITHLAYGFMGFNGTGDIGSWDSWADLAGPKYVYGKDFYDLLPVNGDDFPNYGSGYSINYPLTNQKFPSTSIIGSATEGQQFYRLAYAKYLKPDMKIIMSFGGWEYEGAGGTDKTWQSSTPPAQVFYNISQDPTILDKFVDNIVDLIKNYKFQIIEYENKYYPIPYTTPNGNVSSPTVHHEVIDRKLASGYSRVGEAYNLFSGIDVDWEYPSGCEQCSGCNGTSICPTGWAPTDEEKKKSYDGYASLLSKLKDKLPNPYFVSTTCGGDPSGITELVANPNIVSAFNTIDRISIMSYDFMNGNNIITHDSPLYKHTVGSKQWNTDAAVTNMLTKISPNKINIGIPYYGRFQYIEEDTLKTLGYIGGYLHKILQIKYLVVLQREHFRHVQNRLVQMYIRLIVVNN
jgi:GH18 family chitinase